MPEKLSPGVEISVSRRSLPADYQMPVMGMATDHYSLGFLLSGDRRILTTTQCYDLHAGDLSVMAPFVYHRTVSLSSAPYESFLVKFTERAVAPLLGRTGPSFLSDMTDQMIFHFLPETQAKLYWLLNEMASIDSGKSYADLVLQGLHARLLTIVHEEHVGGGAETFPSVLTEPVIEVLARMEESYGEPLRLSAIADELGYSEAHLSRMFRKQMGASFSAYLSRLRIRHVCTLLAESMLSVGEIALSCGYSNGDYLSARFHAAMGVTPGEFRRQARGD